MMIRIIRIIKTLLNAKFEFKKPEKKKILIFDYKGGTAFYYKYFHEGTSSIFYVRGEIINLYIVLSIIFNFKLITQKKYIDEYIRAVKPEYIFHNSFNRRFFEINKNDFNFDFVKVFTQAEKKNHLSFNEFILNKKNLNADYLFVESKAMGAEMAKFIHGKYIVIGMFKNNAGPKVKQDQLKNKLIYISQYRNFKRIFQKKKYIKETIDTVSKRLWNMKYSYKQFYEADLVVAKQLKDYCKKRNIKFQISGTSLDDKEGEKKFYENELGKNDWEYLARSKDKNGYDLTLDAKYLATIDSTLGYECFARGQRVCFFSIRSKFLKTKYSIFGWPHTLAEEGSCWTLRNNDKDFKRMLNFLFEGKDNEWEDLYNNELKDVFFYDFQNSIYKNFLIEKGLASINNF